MTDLPTRLRKLADQYEALAENAEDRADHTVAVRWSAKADALYVAASMAEKA